MNDGASAAPEPMRPEDDPAWASYAETILIFHGDPQLEVDLARPVTPAVRDALVRQGLPGPFGLLTPCNPRGRRTDATENDARLARFLAALDRDGIEYVRVDGVSPDRQHREPGVALRLPQADVIDLARGWEQSAIYWWDGERFYVLGALTRTEPWPMGDPS
jgi:hypothetical protein